MNSIISYNESEYKVMTSIASQMVKSGYFSDVRDVSMAIVKIQAGKELGIPPFAAMSGIHVIQNKPVLGANVIATLVKNDPRYDYKIKLCNNDSCLLDWYEDGKCVGQAGFTFREAQDAGLATKDNWKKYTSDMLFARAISRGARRFAPGIFGGSPVYTPDEMGLDTDEEGYIDAQTITIEAPEIVDEPVAEAEPEPVEPMTIEKACATLNSEDVPYGEIDSDKLSMMTIGINKALNKKTTTPDDRKVYEDKLQAIKVILQARADGSLAS